MPKDKNGRPVLSPSSLNLFLECPKCFWLEKNRGIHRPSGAFPSLPGGIDSVLKKYFDKYRKTGGLPPEIDGQVEGKLLDDPKFLHEWRVNVKGIRWYSEELDAELMGALDDCLVVDGERGRTTDDVYYIPVDYKTRGWSAKEDSHTYYQNQLNCYALLLEKNGFKTKGFAYLIFYSPAEVLNEGGLAAAGKTPGVGGLQTPGVGKAAVLFNVEPRKVAADPAEAYKVFKAAVKTLRGLQPHSHSFCKFCSWGKSEAFSEA